MKIQRFAVALAGLTFCLLVLGGLVHNTRSSLACPDWPLCFGQFFPRMVGGVLVEHSHRLTAATVGLLTIVLFALTARRGWRTADPVLPWLSGGAVVCVIAQGVLGGLTVLYRLPTWISTTHLAVSMIFFSLIVYLAFRLRASAGAPPLGRAARIVTLGAAVAVYAQMVLGALMRHLGAGLACVEVPLCKGQLFPSGSVPYVHLHMLHRLLGVVVLGALIASAVVVLRAARGRPWVRAVALAAPLGGCAQLAIGLWSVTSFLDALPVTLHLAVAAALLASQWSLYLIARAEARPADAVAPEEHAPTIAPAAAEVLR
jgi:heme A synthase